MNSIVFKISRNSFLGGVFLLAAVTLAVLPVFTLAEENIGYIEGNEGYIPDYDNIYIPDYDNNYYPDYSNSYVPDYDNNYIPDYDNNYIPDYDNNYIPDYDNYCDYGCYQGSDGVGYSYNDYGYGGASSDYGYGGGGSYSEPG